MCCVVRALFGLIFPDREASVAIDSRGVNLALTPAEPVSVIGFPFGLTAGGVFGVRATGFLASEPAGFCVGI